MSDGEGETGLIIHRCAVIVGSDIIEAGVIDVGHKQRMLRVLTNVLDCSNLPVSNALGCSHRAGLAFHSLTYRQRNTRTGLGQIFAQNQYGVILRSEEHTSELQPL